MIRFKRRMTVIQDCLQVLRTVRDGFNVGVNDGTADGQTVDHAHVHVIPRSSDDVPDPLGGIRLVGLRNDFYQRFGTSVQVTFRGLGGS